MKKIMFCLSVLMPLLAVCQIPAYYSGVNFSADAASVKSQLANLITVTHTTDLPYTANAFDTWDAIELTDENPDNTSEVLLIYGYDNNDGDSQTDYSRNKTLSCHISGCTGLWNREHVFAKSLATPALDTDSPGSGTDVHNLRAADGNMNSSRNNRPYTSGTGNAHTVGTNYFYPGDEWKGDVARIVMYMYLRYNTQCLPNNVGSGSTTFSADMPDIFLQWNAEDPVTVYEQQRNTILENIQGNRNPFIDNPYLATYIWGGTAATDTWGTFATTRTEIPVFEIYPTVTTDKLYVTNTTQQHLTAVVYTITGQQVPVEVVNNAYVNVASLNSGMYILRLTTDGNTSQQFKFMKK